jgi:hypothetical protein
MAGGYQEFAYTSKELLKGDQIGDGQIDAPKLSPGLFQQLQLVKSHTHDGVNSSKFSIPSNQLALETWSEYTPIISCGSGSFTTVSATGRYKKLGKVVHLNVVVTITNNGTAGSSVRICLPFTAASNYYVLYGREITTTGHALVGTIISSGNYLELQDYDNAYPGANGYQLVIGGTYEAL